MASNHGAQKSRTPASGGLAPRQSLLWKTGSRETERRPDKKQQRHAGSAKTFAAHVISWDGGAMLKENAPNLCHYTRA